MTFLLVETVEYGRDSLSAHGREARRPPDRVCWLEPRRGWERYARELSVDFGHRGWIVKDAAGAWDRFLNSDWNNARDLGVGAAILAVRIASQYGMCASSGQSPSMACTASLSPRSLSANQPRHTRPMPGPRPGTGWHGPLTLRLPGWETTASTASADAAVHAHMFETGLAIEMTTS